MQIRVSGEVYPSLKNSFNGDDRVEERTVSSFTLITDRGIHFSKGQPVEVTDDDGDVVFSGYIFKSHEVRADLGTTIYHEITCTDNHYIADRRLIARAYQDMYAGEIIEDLIGYKLAEEGVTYRTDNPFGKTVLDGGTHNVANFGIEFKVHKACNIQEFTVHAYTSGAETFYIKDMTDTIIYTLPVSLVVGDNVITCDCPLPKGHYWIGRESVGVDLMRTLNTLTTFPYTSDCGSMELLNGMRWNDDFGNGYYYYFYNIKLEPSIQKGDFIEEAVFNYISCTQAIQSIADKTGMYWHIKRDKTFVFGKKDIEKAPFDIDKDDVIKGTGETSFGNHRYRNVQYVRGGKDITDLQTEYKKGDGESKSFTLGFPMAKEPTIQLSTDGGTNWIPQNVGVKGLSEGNHWYWTKGSSIITQDSGKFGEEPTPMASNHKIKIDYQGLYEIVILTYDTTSIAEMQSIEGGGTGKVEDVIDNPNITNRSAGFQEASKQLEKNGKINPKTVKFRTWRKGLEVGQLLKIIELDGYDINNEELFIESIYVEYVDGAFEYEVVAVEGNTEGSWTRMFYTMATKGQTFIIRENIKEDEILVTLQQFSKTWQTTPTYKNIFLDVTCGDSTICGDDLYPMFEEGKDDIQYVQVYDAQGNILLRKKLTKQTIGGSGEIISTVYLAPFECNEPSIAEIGWWAGREATDDENTGVEVDRVVWNRDKTDVESIQVDKTDSKGW